MKTFSLEKNKDKILDLSYYPEFIGNIKVY